MNIKLSGETATRYNLVANVSEEDYDLNIFKWHARKDGNTFYALRRRPRKEAGTIFIAMHILIAERMHILNSEQPEVDHIDRNGINNYRNNLRASSRRQNRVNCKINAKSGYIGVTQTSSKRWVARLGKLSLGHFDSPKEAATAYDLAALDLYGEYAVTNFITTKDKLP